MHFSAGETETGGSMVVDLAVWEAAYQDAVLALFGGRVVCAGLQGSYARGEADETSDIDAVLVLDRLDSDDLTCYRGLVANLPYAERMCGFVSGKAELLAWDAAELVGFYFDTICFLGDLAFLQDRVTADAAKRSVHLSACSLYHSLCHAAVFEEKPLSPAAISKAAFFIMRTQRYIETGVYPTRLSQLLPGLDSEERALLLPLQKDVAFGNGQTDDSLLYCAALGWCARIITHNSGLSR